MQLSCSYWYWQSCAGAKTSKMAATRYVNSAIIVINALLNYYL